MINPENVPRRQRRFLRRDRIMQHVVGQIKKKTNIRDHERKKIVERLKRQLKHAREEEVSAIADLLFFQSKRTPPDLGALAVQEISRSRARSQELRDADYDEIAESLFNGLKESKEISRWKQRTEKDKILDEIRAARSGIPRPGEPLYVPKPDDLLKDEPEEGEAAPASLEEETEEEPYRYKRRRARARRHATPMEQAVAPRFEPGKKKARPHGKKPLPEEEKTEGSLEIGDLGLGADEETGEGEMKDIANMDEKAGEDDFSLEGMETDFSLKNKLKKKKK